MFNDLFWALYWIDVLSSVGRQLGLAFFAALIMSMVAMLLRDFNETTPRFSSALMGFVPTFILVLMLVFIPSKETMYMMLGVKTTDNIVNSETGKKLQQIVDKEIDNYLKKFSQE